jgi:hypothetical protein
LGVARGHPAGGLGHQCAVAVVGVGRAAARGGAAERIVRVRCGAVVEQVAGIVVAKAGGGDLVACVVDGDRRRPAVDRDGCAIAGQIVGVGIQATAVRPRRSSAALAVYQGVGFDTALH